MPVRRDGFALPLAIMVLALMTMGLVAGFAVSTSEQSTIASQRGQSRAYSMAQTGMEQFLTRRIAVSPDTFCKHCWLMNKTVVPANAAGLTAELDTLPTRKETTYVRLAGGGAIVRVVPVRVDVAAQRGTYFISSTGIDSLSGAGIGSTTFKYPTRTVGAFVTFNKTTINVLGALVSFSGLRKNGTGAISGSDGCAAKPGVAGITVPAEESVRISGGSFNPSGNPPYDTLQALNTLSTSAKLDWAGIRNGTAMQPDIVIPGGTFPTTAQFAADTNYWPVIHIKSGGTFVLSKGRGMLIVDNDLTINGSNQWDGVILVGGQLTSNGNNVSNGTVMSGLNRLIGIPVPATQADDDVLNGTKSYQYNSCSVAKATQSMARYTLMPNTWMDNVAGY